MRPPASILLARGFYDIRCCDVVCPNDLDAKGLEVVGHLTGVSTAARVEARSSEARLNVISDEGVAG